MYRHVIIAAAAAVALSACASGARMEAMTVTSNTALAPDAVARNAITVQAVTGGEPTNPLWKSEVGNPEFQEALRKSLIVAGMFAESGGKYHLNAALLGMDQPWIGFDFTVTSHVRYSVVETATGKTVFDRTIDAKYTATMSHSVIGVERLRLANEGAIRENIAQLIAALAQARTAGGEGGGWTSGGAPVSWNATDSIGIVSAN